MSIDPLWTPTSSADHSPLTQTFTLAPPEVMAPLEDAARRYVARLADGVSLLAMLGLDGVR